VPFPRSSEESRSRYSEAFNWPFALKQSDSAACATFKIWSPRIFRLLRFLTPAFFLLDSDYKPALFLLDPVTPLIPHHRPGVFP
jgi:hypothetical protein